MNSRSGLMDLLFLFCGSRKSFGFLGTNAIFVFVIARKQRELQNIRGRII
jgi:hypothetical protein